MIRSLSLTLLMLCPALPLVSQNLVPDPGFEITRRMPTKHNNGVTCTKNWGSATGNGGCDYYHYLGGRHAGVPRNIFGRQQPHSGVAYAGICVRRNFIEYLQTTLSDTLEKDQEYLVEFYYCRAERSLGAIKEIGVLFTKKQTLGLPQTGMQRRPSVDTVCNRGFRNKKAWTKFSAVYKAQGNEKVLILGFFNYHKPGSFRSIAHYYIDDVSVTPLAAEDGRPADTGKETAVVFSPEPGKAVTLQNIFFVTNKSELLPASFPELNKLVEYLLEQPQTAVKISGHTDNTGMEKKNILLSDARAKAVADYLIANGIQATRIVTAGLGSSHPVATNDTADGREKNRRVEFMIIKK